MSQRVEGSPAVIVSAAYGYSANMERIMKAQTLSDSKQMGLLSGHRSMEINPRHPIVHELNKKVTAVPCWCLALRWRLWGGVGWVLLYRCGIDLAVPF